MICRQVVVHYIFLTTTLSSSLQGASRHKATTSGHVSYSAATIFRSVKVQNIKAFLYSSAEISFGIKSRLISSYSLIAILILFRFRDGRLLNSITALSIGITLWANRFAVDTHILYLSFVIGLILIHTFPKCFC